MGKSKSGSLRSRIKAYEEASNYKLINGLPVVIRLDGKAFRTFTRDFKKPYDEIVSSCMQSAMLKVCKEAQNCVMGYTQSDEITIIVCDYLSQDATAWFNNRKSKIEPTTASMVTLAFYKQLMKEVLKYKEKLDDESLEKESKYIRALEKAIDSDVCFDSRAFNVPQYEIANIFIDRQGDAERNSIQMLAQSVLGKKEIKGISNKKLQDIMFTEKGVNWNDVPTKFKRGSCCIKVPTEVKEGVIRNRWIIDNEIPIFTENREYILSKFETKNT